MSLDTLPDELIVRIFCHLLDDEVTLPQLMLTCKRFCRIINQNRIMLDIVMEEVRRSMMDDEHNSYASRDSEECVNCAKIMLAARLKYVKSTRLYLKGGLNECCLDTIRTVKPHLSTITIKLRRTGYDAITLSVIYDSLVNLKVLFIDDYSNETSMRIPLRELGPINRILDYLSIEFDIRENSTTEKIMMQLPARHVAFYDKNSSFWSTKFSTIGCYILNHQEVLDSFTIRTYFNIDRDHAVKFFDESIYEIHKTDLDVTGVKKTS
jgi:hypothetical protein